MPLPPLPLLPTSVVGSHARPGWLALFNEAARTRTLGTLDLQEAADDAVLLAIADMTEAGIDVISDGEMRRTQGYYRSYFDRIENFPEIKDPPLRTLGINHYDFNREREVVGPIRAPQGLGIVEEFRFLQEHTTKPVKVTVPGPLNFAREVRLTAHYKSTFDLAHDFAKIINAELKALMDVGADFIQIDEPSYVVLEAEPREIVDLFNATVLGIPAKVALHVCFGNRLGRPRAVVRSYRRLFPTLREAKADQFVFEFANRQMAEADLWEEFDVPQELAAGVVDVKAYAIETPAQVAERVRLLLRHVPSERLWLVPDCGFSQTPRWIAVEKLRALAEGARTVRRELEG